MPSHLLTNIKIQKYYQNEPKINGVSSIINFPKIKDDAYVTNIDQYKSKRTYWIASLRMVIMWHILIALELNIFHKKLKSF